MYPLCPYIYLYFARASSNIEFEQQIAKEFANCYLGVNGYKLVNSNINKDTFHLQKDCAILVVIDLNSTSPIDKIGVNDKNIFNSITKNNLSKNIQLCIVSEFEQTYSFLGAQKFFPKKELISEPKKLIDYFVDQLLDFEIKFDPFPNSFLIINTINQENIQEKNNNNNEQELELVLTIPDIEDINDFNELQKIHTQKKLAFKNLEMGYAHGAIFNFENVISLDMGDFLASFWLSRLYARGTKNKDHLHKSIYFNEIATNYIDRFHKDCSLIKSLLLITKSRAYFHLENIIKAKEYAICANKKTAHLESLIMLLELSLNEIKNNNATKKIEEAINYMKLLFFADNNFFFKHIEKMLNRTGDSIAKKINEEFIFLIQTSFKKIYKLENSIITFAVNTLNIEQFTANQAKPIPIWQQIQLSRKSTKNQLKMLQELASNIYFEATHLEKLKDRLKSCQELERKIPSQIDTNLIHLLDNRYTLKKLKRNIAILLGLSSSIFVMIFFKIPWFFAMFFALFLLFFANMEYKKYKLQKYNNSLDINQINNVIKKYIAILGLSDKDPKNDMDMFENLENMAKKACEKYKFYQNLYIDKEKKWLEKCSKWLELVCKFESHLDHFSYNIINKKELQHQNIFIKDLASLESDAKKLMPNKLIKLYKLQTKEQGKVLVKKIDNKFIRFAVYFDLLE